jgi:aminoglycoside/choline kinase family phosphotransferase
MSTSPTDERLATLSDWLRHELALPVTDIHPASSDASFRRYFRAITDDASFIVMDAPPPMEDVRPFMSVAALLRQTGVRAPKVHAADETRGFLLLDDFGGTSYLDRLDADNADALYGDALDALARLQAGVDIASTALPPYDETLLWTEMDLFRNWFLQHLLGLTLTPDEHALLDRAWRLLTDSALEQPRVCVHRDYHSRNLMALDEDNPGVLDFQDAVVGPVTYDLVSLLRDCYIAWPNQRVEQWALGHRARLVEAGRLKEVDADRFLHWFDLMGVQRHLKAIGIFSRLKLRDGKGGYLGDIPRTLDYVTRVLARYEALADFHEFLGERVLEPADRTLTGLRA